MDEPYEAWKDMPEEAIEYIKSWPEFDASIFKRVTGIDVNEKDEPVMIVGGKKYKVSEVEAVLGSIKSVD